MIEIIILILILLLTLYIMKVVIKIQKVVIVCCDCHKKKLKTVAKIVSTKIEKVSPSTKPQG